MAYTIHTHLHKNSSRPALLHGRPKLFFPIFGGYDGGKNHNTLFVFNTETFEWSAPQTSGVKPTGRNGHSATLLFTKKRYQVLIRDTDTVTEYYSFGRAPHLLRRPHVMLWTQKMWYTTRCEMECEKDAQR